MLNFDNTVGAVGFVPVLFSSVLPLGPIRVHENGDPVRDPHTGLCIRWVEELLASSVVEPEPQELNPTSVVQSFLRCWYRTCSWGHRFFVIQIILQNHYKSSEL